MTPRARWAVLGVLLAVLLGTAAVAGRSDAPTPPPGVERLGPESGEAVADYLRRAAASLPPSDTDRVWALVQLTEYLDAGAAAELAGDVRISRVLLRVPLPRVQTAILTRDVAGQRPAAEIAAAIRAAAAQRTTAAAHARAAGRDRAAAVAAAEAERLWTGCACVLALLVRADRAALQELAGADVVRAVHASPPGIPLAGVATAPLLPEQTERAGPVPDDGPVVGAGFITITRGELPRS